MGRDATKAANNRWFKARKRAASSDERLLSREGAAELLGMSVSSVADAELGLTKSMPVEKAVLMADLYNDPSLLNYYCLNECPIGKRHCISDKECDLDRITVKLMKSLDERNIEAVKTKLLDIAEDGVVSDDEQTVLGDILQYLEKIAKLISELKIIGDRVLGKKYHGVKGVA